MASESQAVVLAQAMDISLDQLFHEWRKPLLRYLVCSGMSEDESRDIVQDTFLRLHQHMLSGGARDNLRGWVFRVAHNAAINRRTSGGQRLSMSLESTSGVLETLPCPNDDPERRLFRKERLRRLHQAMKELSVVERACVLLRSQDCAIGRSPRCWRSVRPRCRITWNGR